MVHPARFVLVGTMNPEEGELRPQLLDRYGMAIDVQGIRELDQRVEILRRLTAYERDGHAFAHEWEGAQGELRQRIGRAMATLPTLEPTEELYVAAAERALEAGVDGHRADLTMVKASLTLAAWQEAETARPEHLEQAAELVLSHRLRRRPFEAPPRRREPAERSDEPRDRPPEARSPAEPPPEAPIVLDAALPEAKAQGTRRGSSAASRGSAGRGHKVFVGLQPPRIPDAGSEAAHDQSLPPHHQYLAFYEYLRGRGVHAVVHVGTHGTAEFTPGKALGLSQDCFPDILQGDLPSLYIYTLGTPSESAIARRRWQATLVSHHLPDFVPSGLYGEAQEVLDRLELRASPGRVRHGAAGTGRGLELVGRERTRRPFPPGHGARLRRASPRGGRERRVRRGARPHRGRLAGHRG